MSARSQVSCVCPPARCDVLILCDVLIPGGGDSIVSDKKGGIECAPVRERAVSVCVLVSEKERRHSEGVYSQYV